MADKILIYDDNCPLCSWYSSLFVKAGLLPANGRKAFSTLAPSLLQSIDFVRGRNEIPLLDTDSGKTWYGIDALLEIFGNKWKWIKLAGNTQPVNWALRKIYKLISYNRKVIVAKKCSTGSIDCAPDLDYFYRSFFIVFFLLLNTVLLLPIFHLLTTVFPLYKTSLVQLQGAHAILVAINLILAICMKKGAAVEYLGQVVMLAFISLVLLLPLCAINHIISIHPVFCGLYFGVAAIVVFREYIRRMQYCGLFNNSNWIAGINLTCMIGFVLYVLK